jgi:hypothetical protein
MARIVIATKDGELIHELDVECGDLTDVDSMKWPDMVVWGERAFRSVLIPDCDEPRNEARNWTLLFEEGTVLHLDKDGALASIFEVLEIPHKPLEESQ